MKLSQRAERGYYMEWKQREQTFTKQSEKNKYISDTRVSATLVGEEREKCI